MDVYRKDQRAKLVWREWHGTRPDEKSTTAGNTHICTDNRPPYEGRISQHLNLCCATMTKPPTARKPARKTQSGCQGGQQPRPPIRVHARYYLEARGLRDTPCAPHPHRALAPAVHCPGEDAAPALQAVVHRKLYRYCAQVLLVRLRHVLYVIRNAYDLRRTKVRIPYTHLK